MVDNISMPKTLSEAGYTSEAMTNDVRSALMRIDAEAPDDNRGRRPTSIRSSDDKDSLNLEIAGTKIGYQQVLQLLQENFGTPPIRVGGTLLQLDGKISAVIRVTVPPYPPIEVTAPPYPPAEAAITDVAALSKLSSVIAERILAVMKPANLANYLYYSAHRAKDAYRVLEQCHARLVPAWKSDCLVVWGDFASDESQSDIAEAKYLEALDWNPRSSQARIGLGWLKARYQGDDTAG